MPVDTPRYLQLEYIQRGTQTEDSPLGASGQQCTCSCSCKREEFSSVSDRSLLGTHPPRLPRFAGRVVSLPEPVEEDLTAFVQPRLASMPAYLPPFFSEELADYGFEFIAPHTRSGGRYTICELGIPPRTPSPPVTSTRVTNELAFYGEPDTQGWITWASSPPKPIPALHGPLSLPYARCPSGAEGTVIESDDRVSNMIWGLGDSQTAVCAPAEGTLSRGASDGSHEDGSAALVTVKLSKRLEGLSMSKNTTHPQHSNQLSGLGLHINLENHHRSDVRSTTFNRQQPIQNHIPESTPENHASKNTRRVPPRGVPARSVRKPATWQLPTPPLSTSTHWTPRLSGNLTPGLYFSPAPSLLASRNPPALGFEQSNVLSGDPTGSVGRSATIYQQDYSLDSGSTVPCSGFDQWPRQTSPPKSGGLVDSSRLERKQTLYKTEYNFAGSRQEDKPTSFTGLIHRRLPILEEDVSFGVSHRHGSSYPGQGLAYKSPQFESSAMDSADPRTYRKPRSSPRPPPAGGRTHRHSNTPDNNMTLQHTEHYNARK